MAALALVLALGAIRLVARVTAGASEFMMQHDVVWMVKTLWLIGLGWGTNGPLTLPYGFGFAAYRLTPILLRPRMSTNEVSLLLRVLGQRKSQTRLPRGVLLDWRQRGPVLSIGASYLATEMLDALELAAFLNRRLLRIFFSDHQGPAQGTERGVVLDLKSCAQT